MTSLNVHPFLLSFLRGSMEAIPIPSPREDRAGEQIVKDAGFTLAGFEEVETAAEGAKD